MSALSWVPDPERVHDLLSTAGCPWPAPVYVDSTGSTNADVVALAVAGAVDGTCLVAGDQTAGRGRHGRQWVSEPGAGLWSSTLVRSCENPLYLPLLAALAVVDVARELGGKAWGIKWPNDVLDSGGRKVAGILVEGVGTGAGAAVVGIGVNVNRAPREFPGAGSWLGESAESAIAPDRSELLAGLLGSLYARVRQPWPEALSDYRVLCTTIGARIHVVLPGGEEFDARGVDVTDEGHLVVDTGATSRIIVAGDVLHASIAP